MQTDVSNVLNDLKKLSDDTDIAIYEHCKANDQVNKWFSIIKETANAIVKGTDVNSRVSKTSPEKNTIIPNLVSLVKCKQSNSEHRVSLLLAQNQKDHVRHINRKSRNSLRKIILEKSGNSWEISKSGSKDNIFKKKTTTPPNSESKEKINETEFKTPLEIPISDKKIKKNSSVLDTKNSHPAPIQNEKASASSDVRTPVTRLKNKTLSQDKEPLIGNQNKEVKFNVTFEKTPVQSKVKNQIAATQIIKKTKKLKTSDDSELKEGITSTPLNETIVLDSDDSDKSIKSYITPHLKRKSSLQLTQENAKKTKVGILESSTKHEGNSSDYNSLKKVKHAKNSSNISLQAKTSGILSQHNSTHEKRILREIQKKEVVSQNTKKIKSLRQVKIQESKKNRELKMEKALQQRMKLEKEKEERLRSRTHSKQEVALQKEVVSKKPSKKVQLQEGKVDTPKKTPTSHKMQSNAQSNIGESLKGDTEQLKSAKKAPPKPVRTPAKKATPTHIESVGNNLSTLKKVIDSSNKTNKVIPNNTSSKDLSVASNHLKPGNSTSTKTSALNATYVSTPIAKAENLTSTPAIKNSKINDTKTPLPDKKPTSYSMTPHQSSFVSYDISEIKSDDSDEEEENNQKPIPSWASGIRLRNAVLNQYYNPIDSDELFGNYFETPDLVSIMGVQKKQYYKRTSSAVWLNSPNRSILS